MIGLEFPVANKLLLAAQGKPELSGTAGLLYSADLIGGWFGGVLGGVVLLPVLGLFGTCLVVCIFKLSAFTILIGSFNVFRK